MGIMGTRSIQELGFRRTREIGQCFKALCSEYHFTYSTLFMTWTGWRRMAFSPRDFLYLGFTSFLSRDTLPVPLETMRFQHTSVSNIRPPVFTTPVSLFLCLFVRSFYTINSMAFPPLDFVWYSWREYT